MLYFLLASFAIVVIALIAWQWYRPNYISNDNDLTYLSRESDDGAFDLKDFYWQKQTNQDYQKHQNAPERVNENGKRIFILEPLEQEQALYMLRLKNESLRFFNNTEDLIFSLKMDSNVDAFICSTSIPNPYQLMNQIAQIIPKHIPMFFAQYGMQFYIYPQDKARMHILDKNMKHWAL